MKSNNSIFKPHQYLKPTKSTLKPSVSTPFPPKISYIKIFSIHSTYEMQKHKEKIAEMSIELNERRIERKIM